MGETRELFRLAEQLSEAETPHKNIVSNKNMTVFLFDKVSPLPYIGFNERGKP